MLLEGSLCLLLRIFIYQICDPGTGQLGFHGKVLLPKEPPIHGTFCHCGGAVSPWVELPVRLRYSLKV